MAETERQQFPPAPRIEEHPAIELEESARAGRQILSTYGWTDKNAGIVRIPIDRAIELQLQRGFPSAKGGSPEMRMLFFACCRLLLRAVAHAQIYGLAPAVLRNVGIEQKMGAQVPLDLPFNDESGRTVTLRQYLGKPVILALVYYQCPSLCNMVLNGVVRSVQESHHDRGRRVRGRRGQLRSARDFGDGARQESSRT